MRHFRWMTGGESHGPRLTAIVEGLPAGLPLLAEHVDIDLGRRQRGYGRGARMKIEQDRVAFTAGVRGGETLGSPLVMQVENRDWANWTTRMQAEPFDPAGELPEPLIRPRPGHADLAGGLKYDRADMRDILERASARETAARTAVGAVAKRLLAAVGIEIGSHVVRIGAVAASVDPSLDAAELFARARASDLACVDDVAAEAMRSAIREAAHAGDTLGGVFEVRALGVPAGLGSHVHWDRKLDGRLAHALVSIQAIKAVEIGDGIAAGSARGSQVHDEIGYEREGKRFVRPSNRAGGLEGGISNGSEIVCRAVMKPIATLKKPLQSVDVTTKEPLAAAFERSDVCAVSAAAVVGEAMVAIVLADALLEKFGGDSLKELLRNVAGYRAQVEAY